MKTGTKIFGAAVLAATALLAAVPWLLPAGAWIPRIEEEAAKRLGVPVKIGGLTLSILPLPHLSVSALDISSGAITAQSIAVYPRLLTLFSDIRVIRVIELNHVAVTRKGADWAAALAGKPGGGGGALVIEQIRAANLQVELAAGRLPPLHAEIDLSRAAALPVARALITTVDAKATLKLEPDASEWKLTFDATDWQLPLGPPLRFTALKGAGRLKGSRLTMSELTAALYGGTLNGKADLSWEKTWKLTGEVKLAGLDILPATQALKVKSALSGKLDASGPFNAQSAKPAGLADAFNADIGFKVNNGVLQGFDLAAAAKNLLKGGGGGSTQFDELSGRLKVTARAYKLSGVRVTSGVLKAEGNVDISAAKQLNGRIDTELKGTGGLVGVPLAVSGTLDNPVLLPTKGSMFGAAVGTVLLPGVGTSVGSSGGDRLGKLFGK